MASVLDNGDLLERIENAVRGRLSSIDGGQSRDCGEGKGRETYLG
jgi:hypothetical protein